MYRSLNDFYVYLNKWAVIDVDEEDLEILGFQGVPMELIDKQKYDFSTAREQEASLMEMADYLEKDVLDQLNSLIMRAKDEGMDKYTGM